MKRRSVLSSLVDSALPTDDPTTVVDDNPFINKVLPNVARTTAGLEPYSGTWGRDQAAHLLRRTVFGSVKADVELLASKNASDAVDLLLAPLGSEASQPLNVDSRDMVPVGTTWVNTLYRDTSTMFTPTSVRIASLKAWWTGLMLSQPVNIREKMTLFWHNHFVTETGVVNDPRYSYWYLGVLRQNATGNFRSLVRQISLEGAMLRYLNGNTNTKSSPNENYGRELQELFTIGKGPEIAPGDYTNYSEADVKAAARVLTGWRDKSNADGTVGPSTSTFDLTRHDTADKQFSADYGNTIIKGGNDGLREFDDMLTMIFAQRETARFISRKLYRWFVYYVIDTTAETNVIEPMASMLLANGYEVGPVLSVLLKSAHFFDPVNMGCQIKNPIDFLVGTCRQFGITFPSAPLTTQYAMWTYLVSQAAAMNQRLGDPPNVAGWPAYYQTPEFYELWINSDTLPKRTRWTDAMIGSGYTTASTTIKIDPNAFAATLTNPGDPNALIDEATQLLFAIPATVNQKALLKGVLIPGLPDYEWTAAWDDFIANPSDATKAAGVRSKLQALFAYMMQMPEYQLA